MKKIEHTCGSWPDPLWTQTDHDNKRIAMEKCPACREKKEENICQECFDGCHRECKDPDCECKESGCNIISPPPSTTIEGWEDKFDEMTNHNNHCAACGMLGKSSCSIELQKSFIKSLLYQAREEAFREGFNDWRHLA